MSAATQEAAINKVSELATIFGWFAFCLLYIFHSWRQCTEIKTGVPLVLAALCFYLLPKRRMLVIYVAVAGSIIVSAVVAGHDYAFRHFERMPSWMFTRAFGSITPGDYDLYVIHGCKSRGVIETRYSEPDKQMAYIRCGRGFTALTVSVERAAFERAEAAALASLRIEQ